MNDLEKFLMIIYCTFSAYVVAKKAKLLKSRNNARLQRVWVREANLNRSLYGFFESSFLILKERDPEQFRACTRMSSSLFDCLLTLLKPNLEKFSWRQPISPTCRLFLTLVYLAQGVSRQYMAMTFKMGVTTIRKIALETCEVIWDQLAPIYLSPPNEEEWKKISNDFLLMWGMPNCIGAVDGKHINLTCPSNTGSQFYNYKGTYSIVLMAICDANYTFTCVDIGAYGSQSDGGVFAASTFGDLLLSEKYAELDLPGRKQLPGSNLSLPHYFVGDAAFPLKETLMKPFPGRTCDEKKEYFNKRLSRARRVIENAFGILTVRWRILRQTMNMSPTSATTVVKGAVVLHNFIKMSPESAEYIPPELVDSYDEEAIVEGIWRKEVRPLQTANLRRCSNNTPKEPAKIRDELCNYLFATK